MTDEALNKEFLYEQIAGKIKQLIRTQTLLPGEKVPSIRRLSKQERVSVSTVMQAYYWLESKGLIEARPQSGFYVSVEPTRLPPEPALTRPPRSTRLVSVADQVDEVFQIAQDPEILSLGAAMPSPGFFPNGKITRILSAIARRNPDAINTYDLAPGNLELRRQIARRSIGWGGSLSSQAIVITSGCTEALNLSLRAVARPGDVVAVESPTYYALLQILEMLQLKVLEIPTCPRDGVNLDELERLTGKMPIKAFCIMANFHNPLGSCMPDENKKRLVKFVTRKRIPLIEDDTYGDLYFGPVRPRTLKTFDRQGWVLHCSSFSKTLAPGFRVGWSAPGRFQTQLTRLKRASSFGNAALPQMMVAEFLTKGGYDLHLRKIRKTYSSQIRRMMLAVRRYFPQGTKVTRPEGGHLLWVELPGEVDTIQLQRQAIGEKIGIVPGPLFTASRRYKNCLRLNAALSWTDRVERSLMILGRLAGG